MEVKLVKICQELRENKYPRDDTLIEKLISTLENKDSSGAVEKFAEHAYRLLSTYMNDVAVIQSDCLAAFLRIIGVIAVANFETLNKKDILDSFLKQCIQISILQKEKSVIYAILFCIKKICFHEDKICLFHDKVVYKEYIKSYLDDSSLFVAKAATEVFCMTILWEYMSSYRSKAEKRSPHSKLSFYHEGSLHEVPYEKNEKTEEFFNSFVPFVEKIRNNETSVVHIFIGVLVYFNNHLIKTNTNVENFMKYLIEEHNIPDLLLQVIPKINDKQRNDSLEVLKGLNQKGLLSTKFKEKMLKCTSNLFKSHKKHVAVQIMIWNLKWFRDVHKDLEIEIEENLLMLSTESLQEIMTMTCNHQFRLLLSCIRSLLYIKHKRLEVVKRLCSCMTRNDQICLDSAMFTYNQPKICQASLDVLCAVISDPHTKYAEGDLARCMEAICYVLSDTGTGYQVVSKTLHCLLEVLKRLQQVTSKLEDEMWADNFSRLKQYLPEKVMNMKWEIRDSAVEFAGNLAPLTNGFPFLLNWLKNEGIAIHVWQDVKDGESYVRASAVCGLTKWLLEPGTKEILLDIVSFEEIFEQVTTIVKYDAEAFPRRAAMEFYNDIYVHGICSINVDVLLKIMGTSINDFDWEVKIGVLSFCQLFIGKQLSLTTTNEVPEYAKQLEVPLKRKSTVDIQDELTVLENMKSNGIAEILFHAMNDCDMSVKEKSCNILKYLHTIYSSNNCMSTKRKVKCEIEESPVQYTYDLMTSISLKNFVKRFPRVLEYMKLDEFKENIVKSSEYDNDLDSLLHDIQVAMGLSIGDVADQDDENNAAAIDCY